jgi:hypothetical protein
VLGWGIQPYQKAASFDHAFAADLIKQIPPLVASARVPAAAVTDYFTCRFAAHHVLTEAGKRLPREADPVAVKPLIIQTLKAIGDDQEFIYRLEKNLSADMAELKCFTPIPLIADFRGPDQACNISEARSGAGEVKITYRGKPTLSPSSIDGTSYKISLSSSNSISQGVEASRALSERASTSARTSQSTEVFQEGRKSASMRQGKSMESGTSTGSSKDNKTSISVSPKTGN